MAALGAVKKSQAAVTIMCTTVSVAENRRTSSCLLMSTMAMEAATLAAQTASTLAREGFNNDAIRF